MLSHIFTNGERLQKVARGRDIEETIAEAAKIIDAAEAQS